MEICLYYYPYTCAMVPYITLTEAKAKFAVKVVNLQRQEHKSANFINFNPKHKVPVLLVNSQPLTENVAINLWISQTFPNATLLPENSWESAKAISLLSWFSGGIHPFLSRVHLPSKVCDEGNTKNSVIRLAFETLKECFTIADNLLSETDYFFDNFTAPDAHFFWCTRRATQLNFDPSPYPNVIKHFERIKTRKSVRKLLNFEKETVRTLSQ